MIELYLNDRLDRYSYGNLQKHNFVGIVLSVALPLT